MKSPQRRDELTLALTTRKTTKTSLTSFVSLDTAAVRKIKESSSEQIVVAAARDCSLRAAGAQELNRHCCAIVTNNDINLNLSQNNKRIVQIQTMQQQQLQNASLATIITTPKSPIIHTSLASSTTAATTNPRPTRLKRSETHKHAPAVGMRHLTRRRFVSPSALVVALAALTCCLTSYTFINQIQASSVSSSSSSVNHEEVISELSSSQSAHADHIGSSSALNDGRPNGNSANDRIDSFMPEPLGGSHGSPMSSALDSSSSSVNSDSSSSSESSSQSSIVASLSSAVAQAAAAAAVAAAKNSLSSSDARSLLSHHQGSSSSPSGRPHAQQQQTARSPGLHLAMKIADSIPEVPYHILHNMKKLDHAAPFYNVAGSKMIGGKGKESSPSLLATALANLGGIEQLSSLFRSPIWKRIADGYGEFTSEFRSLFRAPAHTMKGPTSSTSKMLRDISVPALLMLLATTIPSEWRPMRTRRKSLAPVDLAAQAISGEQMVASASAPTGVDLPGSFSLSQAAFGRQSANFGQNQVPSSNGNLVPDFSAAVAANGFQNPLAQLYNQVEQQQQQQQVGQLARVASDIQRQQSQQFSGQPETANSGNLEASWMSPATASQPTNQNFGNINTNGNNFAAVAQQERQPIRRVGDLAAARLAAVGSELGDDQVTDRFAPMSSADFDKLYSNQQQENTKPVNEQLANGRLPLVAWQQPSGLFSSLTSPASQLMNSIINANGNFVGQQQQQQERLDQPQVLMRREQLDEKHKYSLVDEEQSPMREDGNTQPATGKSHQAPNSLLSAVGQAISGAFNPMKSMSAEFSSNGIQARQFSPMIVKPSVLIGSNNQNELHQREISRDQQEFSPMRNLHQQAAAVAPVTAGAEARFFDSGESNNNLRDMARKQIQLVLGKLTAMPEATFNKVALAISPKATSPFRSSQTPGSQTTQTQQTLQSPQLTMANLIANAGSSAMKFMGLKNNKSFTSSSVGDGSSLSNSSAEDLSSVASNSNSNNNLKNKSDSSSGKGGVATQQSKRKLAGMVNMLVNTLTNRNQQPSSANSMNETQATNSNLLVAATNGGEA